jgi:hypothetical protein
MPFRIGPWKASLFGALTFAGLLMAVLAAAKSAGASSPAVDPLASPPGRALVVSLNCGGGWNPACRPRAASRIGARVTSYFYIDGRYRGPANRDYANGCVRFRLSNGYHTARVHARDSRGNIASTGTLRVIRCDRARPVGTPGVWGVSARPRAWDALSGVASRRFYVDHYQRAWRNYSNLCAAFRLRRGLHVASVRVADYAGNVAIVRQNFRCR